MEIMNSIYVHLRPDQFSFSSKFNHSDYVYTDLPEYAGLSIKQTKYFLQREPILITNDVVNKEFKKEIECFFNLCELNFPSFFKDPFWFLTLVRLYVVYLFCNKYKIEKFIHLEYDNLIYSNLKELDNLKNSVYFTQVGPYCSSAGFVFCNSLEHFENFNKRIQQIISKGQTFVKNFTQYGQLSEMILIDLIYSHTKNTIDYLPILPINPGDINFKYVNSLFDCASYGQYLGGTNNGHVKGWYGLHQYIGQKIHSKEITIFLENKHPFINFKGNKIKINNLHIHSKQLQDFICV